MPWFPAAAAGYRGIAEIDVGVHLTLTNRIFAALLHMTVHGLTKSAIFFAVGHASQIAGTQRMDRILGLIHRSPTVGWGLTLGTFGILGLPPFGVFRSEFLIITSTMHAQSWATPVLLVPLAVAFAGAFGKVQPMVREHRCPGPATLTGVGAGLHPHGAGAVPGRPLPGTVVPARGGLSGRTCGSTTGMLAAESLAPLTLLVNF